MSTKNQSYLKKSLEYENITFDIEYNFYPSEPEITYYSDMSGSPSTGAEVEIQSVKICEFEVYDIIYQKVIDALIDLILNEHENEY